MATKWRQRQRETPPVLISLDAAEPDLTLLALNRTNKSFMGYKSMAAVNILAWL